MSVQALKSYLEDPSTNYLKVESGRIVLMGRHAVNITDRLLRFIGRLGYGPYSLSQVARAVFALENQSPELIEEAYRVLKAKITSHNSKSSFLFKVKVDFPKNPDLKRPFPTVILPKDPDLKRPFPTVILPKDPDLERPFPIVFKAEQNIENWKHNHICERLCAADFTFSSDISTKTITIYHDIREIETCLQNENLDHYFDVKLNLERPWFSGRFRSGYHISPENCNEFLNKKNELITTATSWIANKKTTQCAAKEAIETPLQLLDEHAGFIVGENHTDNSARKYLVDNMAELKKRGVTHLFLEHLAYDSIQKHLDTYFTSKQDKLPQILHNLLADLNQFFSPKEFQYTDLVLAAKKAGIRVVALDTTVSYSCGSSRTRGVTNTKNRYAAMNYVATRIIEREMTKAKGQKYVALVGSGHVSTVKDEQVAGVAELLHVPSVVIEMNKEDKIAMQRNVKDLHNKISHVSLYMQTPQKRWTLPVFYKLGN